MISAPTPLLAIRGLRAAYGKIEALKGVDLDISPGEIVSGKVSVAEASSTQSLLRDHKQVAWWILNIVIILIAATAISRRKG